MICLGQTCTHIQRIATRYSTCDSRHPTQASLGSCRQGERSFFISLPHTPSCGCNIRQFERCVTKVSKRPSQSIAQHDDNMAEALAPQGALCGYSKHSGVCSDLHESQRQRFLSSARRGLALDRAPDREWRKHRSKSQPRTSYRGSAVVNRQRRQPTERRCRSSAQARYRS